jgi:hypothetical protein
LNDCQAIEIRARPSAAIVVMSFCPASIADYFVG